MTIKLSNLLVFVIIAVIFTMTVGMPIVEWFNHATDLADTSSRNHL